MVHLSVGMIEDVLAGGVGVVVVLVGGVMLEQVLVVMVEVVFVVRMRTCLWVWSISWWPLLWKRCLWSLWKTCLWVGPKSCCSLLFEAVLVALVEHLSMGMVGDELAVVWRR